MRDNWVCLGLDLRCFLYVCSNIRFLGFGGFQKMLDSYIENFRRFIKFLVKAFLFFSKI